MKPSDKQAPIVILGAGYTGHAVYDLACRQGLRALATSRSPESHLASIPAVHRITFDLQRRGTWRNLPDGADVIWCFPAVPQETVEAFAKQTFTSIGRIVVLGSTSAYDVKETAGRKSAIDESASIDLCRPRVRGEEYLRVHHRSIILRVAGIYGPGRHVLDWIRSGKVGASHRYVNLIHVEDLAGICLFALERGRCGETYNVSDGQPRSWADICEVARRRWGVKAVTRSDDIRSGDIRSDDIRSGKRISIEKLNQTFAYSFRFPDLYAAMDLIESTQI